MLKNIIRKITPNRLIQFYQQPVNNKFNESLKYGKISYSQEGEDIVLSRIFDKQKKGFYVDIGAHHPMRFSNTMHFYSKGWRGINVDPLPGMKSLFDNQRPKDITIEKGISSKKQSIKYFYFAEPAFNTFDEKLARKREQKSALLKTIDIQCLPLGEMLQNIGVSEIDFLSIDVEGLELEVLKSNDWSSFIPKVIVLEVLDFDFNTFGNSNISQFLKDKGYFLFSKLFHSAVFVHEDNIELVNR